MRKLIVLLLVVLPVCLMAQKDKASVFILNGKQISSDEFKKIDSSDIRNMLASKNKNSSMYSSREIPDTIFIRTKSFRDTTYISDDVVSDKKLDPADILQIEIFKEGKNSVSHGPVDTNKRTVIITTKKFAQKKYQNRFSEISENYKSFLEKSNYDDRYWTYVINKKVQANNSDATVKVLYQTISKKIKKIEFVYNQKLVEQGFANPFIIITTKR